MSRVILAGLAVFASASIAIASVDTTPEKTVDLDCATIRTLVATYGMEAVAAMARAQGVSDRAAAAIARRCLR